MPANDDVSLLESGNFADAVISCGERSWNVHKCILTSRCRWFDTAFKSGKVEKTNGKIVLVEQDANLVDVLLRFIYAQDVNIAHLSGGKDLPALCVRTFRLADFFLLDILKGKATQALKSHIERTMVLGTETDDAESPTWLTEILDALAEAYKDASTETILEVLLGFVCQNWMKMFKFNQAIAFLHKTPVLAVQLIERCAAGYDALQSCQPKFTMLGLPVAEAVDNLGSYYNYEMANSTVTGPYRFPCMLFPTLSNINLFTPVNPETQSINGGLGWIVPPADQVTTITRLHNAEVLRVDLRMLTRQ